MVTTRTRMSPAARRQQFIALGVELAKQNPLENVTIEAVAESAGVSKGLLFHYFESKADFAVQVVRAQADTLLEMTQPQTDLEDPLAMLHASVSAYVDYVTEHQTGFIGVIRGAGNADPNIRAVAVQTRGVMVARIVQYLPELGIEPSPRIELAVAGWTAFVEETIVRWLDEPIITRDELIAVLVPALPALAGLAMTASNPMG